MTDFGLWLVKKVGGTGRVGACPKRRPSTRNTTGQFDAVVSIEMLEAVGEEHWPRYFQTLYQRLKPGASAVIQVIMIADERFHGYRRRPDFIQR